MKHSIERYALAAIFVLVAIISYWGYATGGPWHVFDGPFIVGGCLLCLSVMSPMGN